MVQNDIQGALNAVTNEMIDTLVLAGTLHDVHQQLERFEGLFDTLILLSPFFGVNTEEPKPITTP